MVLLPILYLGILSTTQVALGIPWNVKPAARYAGYDLERGPVLYEAYYPEEQEPERQSPTSYQEKRYFDRSTVPERSYQILSDPYEINPFHQPEASSESNEDYIRLNSARLSFANARAQLELEQNDEGMIDADKDQPSEEYVVFGEQPLIEMNRERKRNTFDDYSFERSNPVNIYGKGYRGEQRFLDKNQMMNFADVEEVQRIVPINDDFIFGEKPSNDNTANYREPLRNFNEKEVLEARNNVPSGYPDQRDKIQPLEIENIFEARPQVINYVFSKPKITKPEINLPRYSAPEIEENDWPRNYGDNLIQAEIKKADEQELKKQEARVTSIEVSELPHHKTRHHHGELPKRNYAHI